MFMGKQTQSAQGHWKDRGRMRHKEREKKQESKRGIKIGRDH